LFYAHSAGENPPSQWQPLSEHLEGVARLAQRFGGVFGAGNAAGLAGLLHDLGKYTLPFQARLSGGEPVDHSTAGAVVVRELATDPRDRIMAEIIAYAIAGHHAGLPDRIGAGGSLSERLKKTLDPLDAQWRDELAPDASGLMPPLALDRERAAFQLAFLGRMIFSCLVDADFRDTEAFYDRIEGRQRDREWPALSTIIDGLVARFDAHMAEKQATSSPSRVNTLRAEILTHVRARAGEPTGLFTLTVPTGGGKTLASLGFALDQARRHGLERIIFAIPFARAWIETHAIQPPLNAEMVAPHARAWIETPARSAAGRGGSLLAR